MPACCILDTLDNFDPIERDGLFPTTEPTGPTGITRSPFLGGGDRRAGTTALLSGRSAFVVEPRIMRSFKDMTTGASRKMTFDDLLLTVQSSSVDEWHKFDHNTVYNWGWDEDENGRRLYSPKTHEQLAIYRKDVDISIAFGATINEEFTEDWTQEFPKTDAESIAVELRYRGQPVFEWVFVLVDEARYLLPLPERIGEGFTFPKHKLPFARLMFGLHGTGGTHQTLESALERAKIIVV